MLPESSRPDRFRAVLIAAFLAALSSACSSDSDDQPTPCERLHEHVVELTLAAAEPADATEDQRELLVRHAEIRRRAGERRADAACSQLTSAQVDCGLAATDLQSYRTCFQGGDR
jgi:hypothetical protein